MATPPRHGTKVLKHQFFVNLLTCFSSEVSYSCPTDRPDETYSDKLRSIQAQFEYTLHYESIGVPFRTYVTVFEKRDLNEAIFVFRYKPFKSIFHIEINVNFKLHWTILDWAMLIP